MSDAELFHRIVQEPGATPDRHLLFVHGIFGMGRNWMSFARALVQRAPHWSVVLVDLRLHGRTRVAIPPHTLEACARDLSRLSEQLPLPTRAIMGHSFGGKISLLYNRDFGRTLEQVWVMDSTPSALEAANPASEVLELMRSLPMPQPSRGAVALALRERGLPRQIATWLATNVEHDNQQFYWALDFDGLEAMLNDFYRSDLWSIVESPPSPAALHFVKAELSPVLGEEACARLEAAEGRFQVPNLHSSCPEIRDTGVGTDGRPAPSCTRPRVDFPTWAGARPAPTSPKTGFSGQTLHMEQPGSRLEDAGRRGPAVFLHRLPGATHWLHVDNPMGLLDLVAGWLE